MYVVFYVVLCGSKASTKATGPILFNFFQQYLYFTLEQIQVKLIRKIPQVNPSFGQKSQNLSKVVVFIFENPGCGLWVITSKPGFKVHTKHVVMSIFTRAQWESLQRLRLHGGGAAFEWVGMFLTPFISNAAQPKPSGRF